MRTTIVHNVIPLSPSGPRRVAAAIARCADRLSAWAALRIGRIRARVGGLPPWVWPVLVAVAAWPDLLWSVRRLLEGPEAPLGFVAWCALALALWQARTRFARSPRMPLLGTATVLVIAANLPMPELPSLARAAIGNLAIVAALASIADRDEPIAPYAGLAILALPILTPLQSLPGFPWHEVTADAALRLLAAGGSEVVRDGTAWVIDGRDVVVTSRGAPELAWVGCFVACVTGWIFGLRSGACVARLPVVGLAVWAAHVLHTTVLIAADAGGVAMTDAMDAAIGLLAFTAVGATIAFVFATGGPPRLPPERRRFACAPRRSA